MPYDPALPAEGSPLVSAEMRGQLQGLKEEIDAKPGVDSAQVDSVTPLPPGSAPTATASLVGTSVRFDFGIPVSISSMVIDSVATVGPADPASASLNLIGEVLHLALSIPRGFDGAAGAPGEVSNAALNAAIGGTSSNSNGVGTLDTPFADPDAETLRGKMNELLGALRRS